MENLYFKYDGVNSSTMGIGMQKAVLVSGAAPNIKEYRIPGRNGSLHEWDGTYGNRRILANCFLLSRMTHKEIREANAWLLGGTYRRLELCDDEEHFYMARAASGVPEDVRRGILNPFAIEFTAKPQKFLKSGMRELDVTSSIYNPTHQNALPILKLTGNGDFTLFINQVYARFTSVEGTIILDTETGNATIDGTTANKNVYFEEDLLLLPGKNSIEIVGDATLAIVPRWYEI